MADPVRIITQVPVEVAYSAVTTRRVTQVPVEVAYSVRTTVRSTQVAVEVAKLLPTGRVLGPAAQQA